VPPGAVFAKTWRRVLATVPRLDTPDAQTRAVQDLQRGLRVILAVGLFQLRALDHLVNDALFNRVLLLLVQLRLLFNFRRAPLSEPF
jgi:hypothetical protein